VLLENAWVLAGKQKYVFYGKQKNVFLLSLIGTFWKMPGF
jgi:hypothetical protein